jgi:RHS repeat-associated protein
VLSTWPGKNGARFTARRRHGSSERISRTAENLAGEPKEAACSDKPCQTSPGLTRREFLQASAASTAALLLGPDVAGGQAQDSESPIQTSPRTTKRTTKVPANVIPLPKSGGAVAGIGETFSPDPFTGTEGISVPLPLSPNRDGFNPGLLLAYSVANGNGPFGIGWRLNLSEIVRKTETHLPTYDAGDTFLLGGETELRPDLHVNPRRWGNYTVHRYRPRFESSFSRIEHWVWVHDTPLPPSSSASFWKITTKDNVTSILGATRPAIVADPDDPTRNLTRIFRWALEISYDGKGNFIHYQYKPEDGQKMPSAERSRPVSQTYLKRIRYGNIQPADFQDPLAPVNYLTRNWSLEDCFFEAVLDYGEHGALVNEDRVIEYRIYRESQPWDPRPDAFSNCRARFEVRTRRLCKRVLMFHRIESASSPTLVNSLDFIYEYAQHGDCMRLASLTKRGYVRSPSLDRKYSEDFVSGKGVGVRSVAYEIASIPPLEFTYSEFKTPEAVLPLSLIGSKRPCDLADGNTALVDLFQRGLPDILETSDNGYWYWKNDGLGKFGPQLKLAHAPPGVMLDSPGVGFAEMSGDGRADLLFTRGNLIGYCRSLPGTNEDSAGWEERPVFFDGPAPFLIGDANLRFLDLTGTGSLDVLITDPERFVWYESRGSQGFVKGGEIPRKDDLAEFPNVMFSDERVHLADMNGDGLVDIVLLDRVQKAIHYWPNLGFGRFGRRVTMSPMPDIAATPESIFFVDVDGNGLADLVYVASEIAEVWLNRSGAEWGKAWSRKGLPSFPANNPPQFVDLLGEGITGMLWSFSDYQYLRLTREKPNLLTSLTNNQGYRVRYEYKPSTEFALQPPGARRRLRRPSSAVSGEAQWQLPFPVHVLSRVERVDEIAGSKLVSTFRYAHGYFDDEDRAFRGFGRVEQEDAEHFPAANRQSAELDGLTEDFHQPPVLTKTWFHTGAFDSSEFNPREGSPPYNRKYYAGDPNAFRLPASAFPQGLPKSVWREAARSLTGQRLRQEVYGLDKSAPNKPYTVSEYNYRVRELQGGANARQTSFFAHAEQELTFGYERDPDDPKITHQFTLNVDNYGHVTKSASLAYPRRPVPGRKAEQLRTLATYTIREYAARTSDVVGFRHGVVTDEQTYELVNLLASPTTLLMRSQLLDWIGGATRVEFHTEPQPFVRLARLIAHSQYRFWRDDGTVALPAGEVGLLALPHNMYRKAFTPGLLEKVFGPRVDAALAREGGYHLDGQGSWWVPDGDPAPKRGSVMFDVAHFCLPVQWNDELGRTSSARYDAHWLVPIETIDALENVTRATIDYRTLLPQEIQDLNGNRTFYAFDALGRVAGTAIAGNANEKLGDSLSGFRANLDYQTLRTYLNDPLQTGPNILAQATTRVVHDLWRYYHATRSGRRGADEPAAVCTLARETHVSDLAVGEQTAIQHKVVYSDGFGREIQTKVRTAPGLAPTKDRTGKPVLDAGGDPLLSHSKVRWIGSGATVYDNKGNAIKKYEPFFSPTHQFESDSILTHWGVTPVFRYDPLGRLIRTDKPDGTLIRVTIAPWHQEQWDEIDTVLEGTWYRRRERPVPPLNEADRRAADLSKRHAATPTVVHFDALQRSFLNVSDNGPLGKYSTHTAFDIQGNAIRVTDARGNSCLISDFDMLGRVLRRRSIDHGDRLSLQNAAGDAIREWDGVGHIVRLRYDKLKRPTEVFVHRAGESERLVQRNVYGEGVPDREARKLRGELYQQYTDANVVTNERFDFKRNITHVTQTVWQPGQNPLDQLAIRPTALESETASKRETFSRSTSYDALNRPSVVIHPDGSEIEYSYNEGGNVRGVRVRLKDDSSFQPHVRNVEYNARGQLTRLVYGNGVTAGYTHDKETFRLTRLTATRRDDSRLQDLAYTYDAAGNVVEAVDHAQEVVCHSNQQVEPRWRFEYDAVYRLTSAEGREHRSLSVDVPDKPQRVPLVAPYHPNDCQALTNYREEYAYDEVGNLTSRRRRTASGTPTLQYQYSPSSNRLMACGRAGEMMKCAHDENGNITKMPYAKGIEWDYADRMRVFQEAETLATYGYDGAGTRVRKTVKRGTVTDDRVYVGDFERFQRHKGSSVELARQTIHVTIGHFRVSCIESVTTLEGRDVVSPTSRTRFQLHDHLDSIRFETDDEGAVMSYEEYHPFGTSAYRAGRSITEASEKRFRYLGKELDEESGFYYFGARYYAPWLGRWVSCDPIGLKDGPNPYAYVGNNPLRYVDHTGLSSEEEQIVRSPLSELRHGPIQSGQDNGGHPVHAEKSKKPPDEELSAPRPTGLGVAISSVGTKFSELGVARGQYSASVKEMAATAMKAVKSGAASEEHAKHSAWAFRRAAEKATRADMHELIGNAFAYRNTGKYNDPLGPGLEKLSLSKTPAQIIESSGKTSRFWNAMGHVATGTGKFFEIAGNSASVFGVGAAGYEIGEGMNELVEGKVGTGITKTISGATSLGLELGAVAVVAAGSASAGAVAALGVAAGGGVWLAKETLTAAFEGRKTPLEIADEYTGFHVSDIWGWATGAYSR